MHRLLLSRGSVDFAHRNAETEAGVELGDGGDRQWKTKCRWM